MGSITEDPEVQRLIKLQDAVRAACPGEDVEIVDAVAVYVNFAHATAVTLEPSSNGMWINITVTEWDRSGGVVSDEGLGSVREDFAPLIVKTFLEEQRRHEEELEAHLAEEPAPRELVDVSKFTHMQQVDNEGNPIGDPIPLKKEQ
jgi:hypothetical protein